jgi:hypothetical protein
MHDTDEHLYSSPTLAAAPPSSAERETETETETDKLIRWRSEARIRWRACLYLCPVSAPLDSLRDFGSAYEEEEAHARIHKVAYKQTLEAISDHITDGVPGLYIRFLPHDIAAAAGLLDSEAAETAAGEAGGEAPPRPPPERDTSPTADVNVAWELREALALEEQAEVGEQAEVDGSRERVVVLRGVGGFGVRSAGLNCSCADTRYGRYPSLSLSLYLSIY